MKNEKTGMHKLPMVGKSLVHLKKRKVAHYAGGKKIQVHKKLFWRIETD